VPLSIVDPTVGGDNGSWGTKLNTALDAIVAFVNTLETAVAARLPLIGGAMTGRLDLKTETVARVDKGSVSGAVSLDLAAGGYFTATITGAATFSVTNAPAGTFAYGFLLRLTNPGAGALGFPAGTKWPGGSAPAFTVSGVDLLSFVTDDNGTTWRASAVRDLR
jgi:molybdopterin-binding protein